MSREQPVGWVRDPAGAIRRPRNYTGGLYAADLFLERVIPAIERSPAYRDGGLIDITFDEAFPPFTFTGNSFANSTRVPATAATSIANDTAGETLYGRCPLRADRTQHAAGQGPARAGALSRARQQRVRRPALQLRRADRPAAARPHLPARGRGTVPGPEVDAGATAPAGSPAISDDAAVITDVGRTVAGGGIPPGAFVGQVTNSPVTATRPNQDGGFVVAGSFALVDRSGRELRTIGPVSGVTLGARTPATDPLFNATAPTGGGGDTGSVLISPFIRPGSVSTRYYNHYSWLRTIEDLFDVGRASPGLDRQGHLGYAAQAGLAPFGTDVFNRPSGGGPPPSGLGAPDSTSLDASPGHPALAIEGDTVSVRLHGGRVLATAVGPAVPARLAAALPAPTLAPCTFTVTLRSASGSAPVSASAFTIVDEQGRIERPTVHTLGGGAPPTEVSGRRGLTLTLSAVLPVGGGRLIWAPASSRPIASWEFDVELD